MVNASTVEHEKSCEGKSNVERGASCGNGICRRGFRNLLSLLEDTRSWINEGRLQEDHPSLPPEIRIGVTRNLSTLTSRATAAMSVVMLYRPSGKMRQVLPIQNVNLTSFTPKSSEVLRRRTFRRPRP